MKKQPPAFTAPKAPSPQTQPMSPPPQINIHFHPKAEPDADDGMVGEHDPDMDADQPIKSLKQLAKLKNAKAMGKLKKMKK